ncbi:DUF3142 domain-containing protein [Hafnia paralvei]|uniref:DUF3142 domain-containing protein n=1 Tax=Hafnia paralvei TaxID=546367 RepID=UPI00163CBF7A|nr:DUF3142 domain-containing protein [Hafnia paralvei]
MGQPFAILLVRSWCWGAIALLFSLGVHASEGRVEAGSYHNFWLWSAVRSQPVLKQAQVLYLHQAEIMTRRGKPALYKRGLPYSAIVVPDVWISVRVSTLDIPDSMVNALLKLCRNWEAAGTHVVGIQIDFDAASYRLDQYSVFLLKLKSKLPTGYKLGVTGLLDWAKTGSVEQLNQLPVDEVVIQTYQGRHTVTRYQEYLPALRGLNIPFKIGLVQNGLWDKRWQRYFATSPNYLGEVVFLLNEQ